MKISRPPYHLDSSLFYDAVSQSPAAKKSGFVKIVSEKRKPDPDEMIEEIYTIINESLEDSYDLGDICILTDKNDLGVKIANKLTKKGITVFSQESLFDFKKYGSATAYCFSEMENEAYCGFNETSIC